jgi:hypothetical protein
VLPSALFGRPDPPSFWDTVADGERIVVARIDYIVRAPEVFRTGEHFLEDLDEEVGIVVRENWKGAGPDRLEVRLPKDYSDTHGLRQGALILAFLRRGDSQMREFHERILLLRQSLKATDYCPADDANSTSPEAAASADYDAADAWYDRKLRHAAGRWFCSGTPNSFRKVREEDLPVLRLFVTEAIALQERAPVGASVKRDWLIRAASRRSTRVYALTWLQSLGIRADQERVAQGFVREPSGGYGFLHVLDFLKDFESPAFDAAAVSVVEAGLARDPVAKWTLPAAQAVLRRFEPNIAAYDLAAAAAKSAPPGSSDSFSSVWAAHARRLGLPMAPPMQIEATDED